MPIKSRERIPRFNPRTDIPTIPNAMSIAGAVLAWRGAKHIDTTTTGVAQVAAGRFIDVLDGIVARKTGQTSDFGALLDAGLDKAVTAIILYEIKSKNLAPTEIIAAITAFNGINAVASAKTIVEAGDETVRPGNLWQIGASVRNQFIASPPTRQPSRNHRPGPARQSCSRYRRFSVRRIATARI